MIVGETRKLRHLESSTTAFNPSAASIAIRKPDLSTVASPPAVTISPGGSAQSQELTCEYTPDLAGAYRMAWRFTVGADTYIRYETYFAGWTDYGALIRRRLRQSADLLPDSDIDPEFAATVRKLVDRFTGIQGLGGYAGLTGLDQDRFDEAAALLTAVRFRVFTPKGVPTGEVSSVKVGEYETTYDNLTRARVRDAQSVEDSWIEEALVALGRVSVIQATYASAAAAFHPFLVSGPTRTAKAGGVRETLLSGVVRLLTDDWSAQNDWGEAWGN